MSLSDLASPQQDYAFGFLAEFAKRELRRRIAVAEHGGPQGAAVHDGLFEGALGGSACQVVGRPSARSAPRAEEHEDGTCERHGREEP